MACSCLRRDSEHGLAELHRLFLEGVIVPFLFHCPTPLSELIQLVAEHLALLALESWVVAHIDAKPLDVLGVFKRDWIYL